MKVHEGKETARGTEVHIPGSSFQSRQSIQGSKEAIEGFEALREDFRDLAKRSKFTESLISGALFRECAISKVVADLDPMRGTVPASPQLSLSVGSSLGTGTIQPDTQPYRRLGVISRR